MRRARIVNTIFWLYLWLSDAIQPIVTQGDFWAERGKQLFRINSHIGDPFRFAGNAIIPLILWFLIDWGLRRAARAKTTEKI